MIARGVSGDALRCLFVAQAKNCVGRATSLEGAGLLKILALEIELRSCKRVNEARGENWRAMNMRLDPFMRVNHVGKRRDIHCHGFSGGSLACRNMAASIKFLSGGNPRPELDSEAKIGHDHLGRRDA